MIGNVFKIAAKVENSAKYVGREAGERLITHIIIPKQQPKEGMILWSDEWVMREGVVDDDGIYLFTFQNEVIILKSYCKEYYDHFYDEHARSLLDTYEIYHDDMSSKAITSIRLIRIDKAYF